MNEYLGCECSVCRKPFAAGDDIVVCPECGTPYHRACYEAACCASCTQPPAAS